jgi:hypothetical protein
MMRSADWYSPQAAFSITEEIAKLHLGPNSRFLQFPLHIEDFPNKGVACDRKPPQKMSSS